MVEPLFVSLLFQFSALVDVDPPSGSLKIEAAIL
jgi:hypothetical protein